MRELDNQNPSVNGGSIKTIYVYVSGPYSNGDRLKNTLTAIGVGEELLAKGYAPFVPHLSHYWPHEHSWDFWMKFCMEWLKKCDVLLRLPGESKGADIEVDAALRNGIRVYYSLEELIKNEQP